MIARARRSNMIDVILVTILVILAVVVLTRDSKQIRNILKKR
jgi:hypothetical protein